MRVQAFADPEAAVAEVKGEGRIKGNRAVLPSGVRRVPACSCGKIALLREYFDPTRAAKAMNAPLLDRDY